MSIPPDLWNQLALTALQSRENARAPYSGFRVGAALLCADSPGHPRTHPRIFGGCNIENATYGLTVCAERVALWKAISEGFHSFQAILVAADTDSLTPPCGACRQLIWEFAGNIPVRMINLRGAFRQQSSAQLLPDAFDSRFLHPAQSPDSSP